MTYHIVTHFDRHLQTKEAYEQLEWNVDIITVLNLYVKHLYSFHEMNRNQLHAVYHLSHVTCLKEALLVY